MIDKKLVWVPKNLNEHRVGGGCVDDDDDVDDDVDGDVDDDVVDVDVDAKADLRQTLKHNNFAKLRLESGTSSIQLCHQLGNSWCCWHGFGYR